MQVEFIIINTKQKRKKIMLLFAGSPLHHATTTTHISTPVCCYTLEYNAIYISDIYHNLKRYLKEYILSKQEYDKHQRLSKQQVYT